MKPGTIVNWKTRSGTPMQGLVLAYDPRRPACKRGVSLGSWTDTFYKPRSLVAFKHSDGKISSTWVNDERLTAVELDEEARYRAELWILN